MNSEKLNDSTLLRREAKVIQTTQNKLISWALASSQKLAENQNETAEGREWGLKGVQTFSISARSSVCCRAGQLLAIILGCGVSFFRCLFWQN